MFALVLGMFGAAIGNMAGYAAVGWMVGSAIGATIDAGNALVRPKTKDAERIAGFRAVGSSYGVPIYRGFGVCRFGGNLIWASAVRETSKRHKVCNKTSGFFGIGSKKKCSRWTEYFYHQDIAIAICQGPVTAVRRIWVNGALVMDASEANITQDANDSEGRPDSTASSIYLNTLEELGGSIAIYLGTTTQSVDPTMNAAIENGNVPAYRGICYLVFRNLDLSKTGYRVPQVSAEIVYGAAGYPTHKLDLTVLDDYFGDPVMLQNGQLQMVGTKLWVRVVDAPGASREIAAEACIDLLTGRIIDIVEWTEIIPASLGHTTNVFPYLYTGFATDRYLFFSSINVLQTYLAVYDLVDKTIIATISTEDVPWRIVTFEEDGGTLLIYSIGIYGGLEVWRLWPIEGILLPENDFTPSANLMPVAAADLGASLPPQIVSDWDGNGYAVNRDADGLKVFRIDRATGRITEWGPYTCPGYVCGSPDNLAPYYGLWYVAADHTLVLGAMCNESGPEYTNRYLLKIDADDGSLLSCTLTNGHPLTGVYNEAAMAQGLVNGRDAYVLYGTRYFRIDMVSLTTTQSWSTLLWDDVIATRTTSIYNPYLDAFVSLDAEGLIDYFRIQPTCLDVSSIVTSLITTHQGDPRPRIVPEDLDLDGIDSLCLYGYPLVNQQSVIASLRPLQQAGFWDLTASGWKLKAITRGSGSRTNVAQESLAAHEHGGEAGTLLHIARQEEAELPRTVAVSYMALGDSENTHTERAVNPSTSSAYTIDVTLPIVLDTNEAAEIARILLENVWAERLTYRFALPPSYLALECGDRLQITMDNGDIHYNYLTQIEVGRNGLLACEAVGDKSPALVVPAYSWDEASTYTGDRDWAPISPWQLWTLAFQVKELPVLEPGAGPGFFGYLFAGAYDSRWPGGRAEVSSEVAATWIAGETFATVSARVPPPPLWTECAVPDWGTILEVTLHDGSLTGMTFDAALTLRESLLIVHNELVCAEQVTLVRGRTYRLTGLHRGRWSTDALIEPTRPNYLLFSVPRRLRTVEAESVDDALPVRLISSAGIGTEQVTFSPTALQWCPLPGCNPEFTLDGSDVTVSWTRRDRSNVIAFADGIDMPMSEDAEAYEVDLVDREGTVTRSFTGLSTATCTYTAAQQATDYPGGTPEGLHFQIYQIGQDYAALAGGDGRGAPLYYTCRANGEHTYRDFSGDTAGNPPADTSEPWSTSGTYTVTVVAGASGGQAMRCAAASDAERAILFEDLGDLRNGEILVRLKPNAKATTRTARRGFEIMLRGHGDTSDKSHVMRVGIDNDLTGLYLARYNSTSDNLDMTPEADTNSVIRYEFGAALTLDAWHWVRAQIEGYRVRARLWVDGSEEPTDWQVSSWGTEGQLSGWIGFGAYDADVEVDVDKIWVRHNTYGAG